ncbi:hypothetical protein CWC39_02945 [Corynebacterium heidelbergense]|uniref:Uncharacterized protein n=1 Tax=Corynebacterium heidelbergense TaxID=2055947 RepID=A0A364VCW2_9CORY|nr:hypothetical protein CWC39_02945 [Corynebacterium heidelbergense]
MHGLVKTSQEGVNYLMAGKPGTHTMGWLRADKVVRRSFGLNPAVLLAQLAQQAAAEEMRKTLDSIDEKLDDVRRHQRDEVLARLRGSEHAIKDGLDLLESEGDARTMWGKVAGANRSILSVQEQTLLALDAIAQRLEQSKNAKERAKNAEKAAADIGVHLAVLAKCFELLEEFGAIELEYVHRTAPESSAGHRRGLDQARIRRREVASARTGAIMERMALTGEDLNRKVLVHFLSAPRVVNALNESGELIEQFHRSLGVDTSKRSLEKISWMTAVQSAEQWRASVPGAGAAMDLSNQVMDSVARETNSREVRQRVVQALPWKSDPERERRP